MSLRDRLNKNLIASKAQDVKITSDVDIFNANINISSEMQEIKEKLHQLLVEKVNAMPNWINYSDDEQRNLIKQFVEQYISQEILSTPLNKVERERLIREILQETKGFGPLDPLLSDESISDILVNGPDLVYVEKGGKLYKTSVRFRDNRHLMNIIERIVSRVGRRIDEKSPMVDARLPDGSRVNAIIPPLALDGASLSIRRFKTDVGTLENLLKWGSMTDAMAKTLSVAVKARLNVIISGGTGAGKTTLLNGLSAKIANDERIITIEDSAELSLQQEHIVRLETRPPNIEGAGEVTARDLVVNALRMRPDRIIIGECRGAETLDMLQAMNTGHDGSITTLHANSPRDALSRLETMVLFSGVDLPEKNIKSQISSAVDIIIQASRLSDGTRRITYITEVLGMENNVISTQDIFKWEQYGIDEKGKVIGCHEATGIRPRFLEKFKSKGIELPVEFFDPATPPVYKCDNPPHAKSDKYKNNANIINSSARQASPDSPIAGNPLRDRLNKFK